MTIKLGSLMPKSEMRLKVTLIMELNVVNSSYEFEVPLGFIPDYTRHGLPAEVFPYEFKYKVTIESASKLQSLIIPENATVLETTEKDEKRAVVECKKRSSQIKLFWRSR